MWPSRSEGTTDIDNGTASLSLTACVREAMEALGSLRRGRAADLVPMDPALQTRIFVMGASVMRPSWGPSHLFWADESALRRNLVMSGSIAARAVVPLVPVQHVAITALKIRPSKLLDTPAQ